MIVLKKPLVAIFVLMMGVSVTVTGAPGMEPFTCSDLASFAYVATAARDSGQRLSRAKEIIDEEVNFSAEDKISFKKLLESIHASKSITPEMMSLIAQRECLKTGKRKP